jgi:hypothetical protein
VVVADREMLKVNGLVICSRERFCWFSCIRKLVHGLTSSTAG